MFPVPRPYTTQVHYVPATHIAKMVLNLLSVEEIIGAQSRAGIVDGCAPQLGQKHNGGGGGG